MASNPYEASSTNDSALDSEIPEAETPLLVIPESFVPSIAPSLSTIESLSFSSLLSPPLQLQTNEAQCGGKLWPAGMVLAEYLLQHQLPELKGKTMFVSSMTNLLLYYHLHTHSQ